MRPERNRLDAYVRDGDELAFEELVKEHVDFVYQTALRKARGDRTAAEEVTQQVFCDLAQKAETLRKEAVLTSWLYRHTHFTTSKYLRKERRRMARERKADMNQAESPDIVWSDLEPVVDEALHGLPQKDREAILLRFFEGRTLKSLAVVLGLSEEAARKRVSRALERLRTRLAKRGVSVLSVGALSSALSSRPAEASPALLLDRIFNAVESGTGAACTSTGTLGFSSLRLGLGLTTAFMVGVSGPLAWKQAEVWTSATSVTDSGSDVRARSDATPLARLAAEASRPTLAQVLQAEGFEQWHLLVRFLPTATLSDLQSLAKGFGGYAWAPLPSAKWKMVLKRWIELDPEAAVSQARRLDPRGMHRLVDDVWAMWAAIDYPTAVAEAKMHPEAAQAMSSEIAKRDLPYAISLVERWPEMRWLSEKVLTRLAATEPDEALGRALRLPALSRSHALASVSGQLGKPIWLRQFRRRKRSSSRRFVTAP